MYYRGLRYFQSCCIVTVNYTILKEKRELCEYMCVYVFVCEREEKEERERKEERMTETANLRGAARLMLDHFCANNSKIEVRKTAVELHRSSVAKIV